METSHLPDRVSAYVAKPLPVRILMLATILIGTNAAADTNGEPTEAFQFHGFAGVTGISTTNNAFFGDTIDDFDPGMHEIGLNASWSKNPDLLISAQVLSRRAGETDDGRVNLDYGFVDYTFVSDLSKRIGGRLGRTKNPIGFYNDTRDVPMTRPSIFLPQSIYFDRTRTLALSADGIQLYGELIGKQGNFSGEISIGNPPVEDSLEYAVFGRDFPGKLKPRTSVLGRVRYSSFGQLDLAFTYGQVRIDYDPAAAFPRDLTAGSLPLDFWILSFQYDWDKFSLTSEYARRKLKVENLGLIPDRKDDGESMYLQGIYRFHPQWGVIARYDLMYNDRHDRQGERFAAQTGLPPHSRYSKDFTVGLRWDPTRNLLLRLEYHTIEGTSWLPPADNPNYPETKKHWNIFALSATLHF